MLREFKTYLESIKGYSKNTAEGYGKDLNKFANWMLNNNPETRWSTITRDDVDAYIEWNVGMGIKPATTNRYLAAISSLYDWFKRNGKEVENPARFESRRKIGTTVPDTVPMCILKKAYENSIGTIHIMFGVLMTTGIRIQELLDIRKCDLDIMNNSIKIHGKGNKERLVYVPKEIMDDLVRFSQNQTNNEPVFKGWEQREVRRGVYEVLRPFPEAIHRNPHAIRHTFATELAKQGVNVTTLAKMMGHDSIKTTQKYIDLGQQEVNEAYKLYQTAFA